VVEGLWHLDPPLSPTRTAKAAVARVDAVAHARPSGRVTTAVGAREGVGVVRRAAVAVPLVLVYLLGRLLLLLYQLHLGRHLGRHPGRVCAVEGIDHGVMLCVAKRVVLDVLWRMKEKK